MKFVKWLISSLLVVAVSSALANTIPYGIYFDNKTPYTVYFKKSPHNRDPNFQIITGAVPPGAVRVHVAEGEIINDVVHSEFYAQVGNTGSSQSTALFDYNVDFSVYSIGYGPNPLTVDGKKYQIETTNPGTEQPNVTITIASLSH